MSGTHKFHNPDAPYFVSFAVVDWLDVFVTNAYKDILLDCLKFCQKNKGMEIYAWVIMSNHVHLVFRSMADQPPELLLGDFKRYTSNAVVKAIKENPNEKQREFFLKKFREFAAKSSNVRHFQFWQHDNQPIELYSNKVISQKIRYIHSNPVTAGYVYRPEDYLYSSAVDYSGKKGLLEDVVIASI